MRTSLFAWTRDHILRLIAGLAYVLVGGLCTSIIKRQFAWRGLIPAFLLTFAGLCACNILWIPQLTSDERPLLMFIGGLMLITTAGAWIGHITKNLAVWECYALVLLAGGLIFIHGAYGIDVLWRPEHTEGFASLTWGIQTLGPMWQRLVMLWTLCAVFACIIGSSLSYLFFSKSIHDHLEWRIAKRYLTGSTTGWWSVQSIITIAGIALGVMALITVTAVMSGYQQEVEDKLLGTNAHVIIQKYGVDFVEYPAVRSEIDKDKRVQASAPFIFSEALLTGKSDGIRVLIKGIEPELSSQVTAVASHVCQSVAPSCVRYSKPTEAQHALGQYLASNDGVPQAVVGIELFKKLNASIGDMISLVTPVGMAGQSNNAPKRLHVRIAGVFASGMYEFDARLVYLSIPTAQTLLGMGDSVTGIEIKLHDPSRAQVIGEALVTQAGGYPYRSMDWRALNGGIFTALKLQKIVMFLVLLCIVIVAAFNIASTLFMNVIDRTQDIGILKSMGANNTRMMRIFVYQGWMAGGVGTALGLVLGLATAFALSHVHIGLAANVYMIDTMRIVIDPWEITATVLSSLAISHLATLYPALRAAQMQPVDAAKT